MKNESEKLNKFKLAVFSQAQKQADDIVSDAQQERKQRLAYRPSAMCSLTAQR